MSHAEALTPRPEEEHLWLQQAAFEQDQCLPLELANQFAQAHAKVAVVIGLIAGHGVAGALLGKALLEATEDIDVAKLALCEPGRCDPAQALAQGTEVVRAVGDDHHGFLHS